MMLEGQSHYQLQEPARNEAVAVTTANTVVCIARNQDTPRKVIVIRNISTAAADIITLNFGLTQATAGTGIVLNQNESMSFSADGSDSRNVWQGSITAKCATANGNLAVFEW